MPPQCWRDRLARTDNPTPGLSRITPIAAVVRHRPQARLSMTHIVKLFGADCFSPRFDFGLLVQNHVQQGFMDFEFSVVFDKTQLAEFVHEETHA
jgi:hypothetical protein